MVVVAVIVARVNYHVKWMYMLLRGNTCNKGCWVWSVWGVGGEELNRGNMSAIYLKFKTTKS